jgi:hypothetical protein
VLVAALDPGKVLKFNNEHVAKTHMVSVVDPDPEEQKLPTKVTRIQVSFGGMKTSIAAWSPLWGSRADPR